MKECTMKYKFTLKQNVFYYFSFLGNIFHIFRTIPKKKFGISVMIRVKNEEDFIALSLKSLNGFADEVVIIDNGSTDNTYKEIEEVKNQLNYKLIIKYNESSDICRISNEALSLTSYKWLFRWDGDFIAHTSGERDITKLREYLFSLNQNNFYLIYPLTISFAGDLFHVQKNKELHSENYIHTYHTSLKYVKRGKFEVLKVPLFYKIKRVNRIHFVHIGTAKSLERLIYRFFWLHWLRENNEGKYSSIDTFIKKELKEKWNSHDIDSVAKGIFKDEIISELRKYEIDEFGDYPQFMLPLLKNPSYKIIYQNGQPFTRDDL